MNNLFSILTPSRPPIIFIRKALFVIALLGLAGLFSCSEKKKDIKNEKQITEFTCDLETSEGSDFVCSNGDKISGVSKRTDEFSRSGKYGVKVNAKNNYALHYNYTPIQLGDELTYSVWRYKNDSNIGAIAVYIGKKQRFYLGKSVRTSGDWELLENHITIKKTPSDSLFEFFVFNSYDTPVYFDDIKIKIINNGGYSVVNHPDLDQVSLKISAGNKTKLINKRNEALKTGVLISEKADWVKAKIRWNDDSEKCEVRLKGDWTDHLLEEKWSLRVNILKGKKAGKLRRFSIQNPLSRGYLLEWIAHKILMEENVLTTKFDFINLKINNKLKGIYSVEEHFTNDLLTAQNRKKGVIIKFDEGPMWQFRSEHHQSKEGNPQWECSAEILPFGKKQIASNSQFLNYFLQSRDLLYQFQQHYGDLDQIFDLDKMAKFLALIDVFKSYHAIIWHNLRFYFNPDTKKLEPIAYDLFTAHDFPQMPRPSFMGFDLMIEKKYGMYYIAFIEFFKSEVFLTHYISYLKRYSSTDFIDNQLSKIQSELDFYNTEIKKEYRFYHFNSQFLYDNAALIREKLPEFINYKSKMTSQKPYAGFELETDQFTYEPIKDESLRAYNTLKNRKSILQLRNFYYKPIIVTGYIVGRDSVYFDDPLIVAPFLHTGMINTSSIILDYLIDAVIFRVEGTESEYSQQIIPYRAPE